MADNWVIWVAGTALIGASLYSCGNAAESRGESQGESRVYSAEVDKRYLALTELCDDLDALTQAQIKDDPAWVAEPVEDILNYDPDGRGVIGFEDSFVIEAVAVGCPEYLEPVITSVEEWRDYQGAPVG